MDIKSVAIVGAIAFAATIGAASAADQFATLDGITAATMSAGEMAVVRGSGAHSLFVHTPGDVAQGGAAVLSTGVERMNADCCPATHPGLTGATTSSSNVVAWETPHTH